jgi:hypothetical protein
MTMFHPSTVMSHKVRLQYSEETRETESHPETRTNHGSFPSFHSSVHDMVAALSGEKVSNASIEKKLAKLAELPTLKTPDAFPGDCDVKRHILENLTPCKSNLATHDLDNH